MYLAQRIRFKQLNAELCARLQGMALDYCGFSGVATEAQRLLHSSASTPSMRSRESEFVTMARTGTPDTGGGNVRVVVRVRGFLPREVERGAECLVEMSPTTQATKLLIPNKTDKANERTQSRKIVEEKNFTFDNSFWSHNTEDEHYAHQEDIYNALGEEFLDHNFEGYHTCIFAYGQTGSGKSYTMMGTPQQPGLIPRTCEDLFERIEASDSPHVSYAVRVSYFEVYNEHVRDLLSSHQPSSNHPNYLKIRESPTEGPYVKDLTDVPVKNYAELLRWMRLGDNSRTTASTKMNDTSSRSHAVFTIMLKQIHHDLSTDSTTERMARIRLVDLAGSERAKATEATGARLREGSNINKSLTTLGRVIAALADPRHGRVHNGGKSRSKDVVPYRDSILTWLLKDSLGGNSKTAMIACIAPSDYDETLSTLRYADQAKHIRTRAIVNQDSVSAAERDAQIAEMQNTIRELQVQVSLANQAATEKRQSKGKELEQGSRNMGDEKLEEYQAKVEKMQRMMEEERLVGESKIRQLVEQNEALRLHLKLAVESLRNPIPAPATRAPSGQVVEEVANPDADAVVVHADDDDDDDDGADGAGKNKDEKPKVEIAEDTEADKENLRQFTPDMQEEDVWPQQNDRHDAEAVEMQARMEDLLKDLGLFRRKVADDHLRFGVGRKKGISGPLGEVRVN